LTKEYFRNNDISGACRVHGGGFAGSIIVWLPNESLPGYQAYIEKVFGMGSLKILRIRPSGAVAFALNPE
jgi:galactokinase